jgi:hypothetical protein
MSDLDRAIDHVAAQLTHVDHDPLFVQRLVASLPERGRWLGWVTPSWIPGLAMIAIVAGIAVSWNQRHTTAVNPAPVLAARVQPLVGQPLPRVDVEHVALVGTKPLEHVERLERVEPARADHERALSALAVDSLAVAGVATEALPDEGSLSVPSLQIADLPLTAEFPQQ